jgi:hypothetical protein
MMSIKKVEIKLVVDVDTTDDFICPGGNPLEHKFDDNDGVIFYHLDNYDLKECQLESILKTDDDLGVEITIEEMER